MATKYEMLADEANALATRTAGKPNSIYDQLAAEANTITPREDRYTALAKEADSITTQLSPLLTGEQVPEEYRRMDVTEYRPTIPLDPNEPPAMTAPKTNRPPAIAEGPQFVARPEPGRIGRTLDQVKEYLREKLGWFEPPIEGQRQYREEHPVKTAVALAARPTAAYISGRGLFVPDVLAHLWGGDKDLVGMIDRITGFVPRPKEESQASLIKYGGAFKTAGALLGSVAPMAKAATFAERIGRAAQLGMGVETANQVSKLIADSENYRGATAILETGIITAGLALAGEGAIAAWNKLFPTERLAAMKALGLQDEKKLTIDQIRRAAAQKARDFHPDKVKGMEDKFKAVMASRDNLITDLEKNVIFKGQKPPTAQQKGNLLTGQTNLSTIPETPSTIGQATPISQQPSTIAQGGAPAEAKAPPSPLISKPTRQTYGGQAPIAAGKTPVSPVVSGEAQESPLDRAMAEIDAQARAHQEEIREEGRRTEDRGQRTERPKTLQEMALRRLLGYEGQTQRTPTMPATAKEGVQIPPGEVKAPPATAGEAGGAIRIPVIPAEKQFVMSKELQRLHDHPVRIKGIENVTESQAKSYFRQLRELAEARGSQRALDMIEGAENSYYSDGFAKSVELREGALEVLHHDEIWDTQMQLKAAEDAIQKSEATGGLQRVGEAGGASWPEPLRTMWNRMQNPYRRNYAQAYAKWQLEGQKGPAPQTLLKPYEAAGVRSKVKLAIEYTKAEKTGQVDVEALAKQRMEIPEAPKGSREAGFVAVPQISPETREKVVEATKKATDVATALPKLFMSVMEPAKAAEKATSKEAYAAVIRGIHKPEAKKILFDDARIDELDMKIGDLEKWVDSLPKKNKRNFMLAFAGKPGSIEAENLQREAYNALPKELKDEGLVTVIRQISENNYKYLKQVAGPQIKHVEDYFYGIFENSKQTEKFLNYWRTTDKFTKQKLLPSIADAINYGTKPRTWNYVENLKLEYMGIVRLDAMKWLKKDLLRMGKGEYIDNMMEAPREWVGVHEPVFDGYVMKPELAALIDSLISTNKITRQPVWNSIRRVNNFLMNIKFIGSIFHLRNISQGALADSGVLGFIRHPIHEVKQIATLGFGKNDPIYKTPEYLKYVERGGSHQYSIEMDAQRALNWTLKQVEKVFGRVALPLKIPAQFQQWLFNSYIPKVSYSKYLERILEIRQREGREETDWEGINVIKEGQNLYGEMNERLFGRSGTTTTALRFFFLAPGFAEGNFRVILKGLLQWGYKGGWSATRSRVNVPNAMLLTAIISTVGTMILTGKLPKKPETIDDIRDLFKIDTGQLDKHGKRIMIDMMAFEKDYWSVYFNVLRGRPDIAVKESVRRIGGMKAPLFDIASDLVQAAMGKAIYDWKDDRIVEITDPWLQKLLKIAKFEIQKLEPISLSVYRKAREQEVDRLIAFVEAVSGIRPIKSEADKREQELFSRIYSLRGEQEELYLLLRKVNQPRRAVEDYNKKVREIMESPLMRPDMRAEWEHKLLVDTDRLIRNKKKDYASPANTVEEANKIREFLVNFEEKPAGIWEGPESLKAKMGQFTERRRELDRKKQDGKLTYQEKYELKRLNHTETKIRDNAKRLEKTTSPTMQKFYLDRIERTLDQQEKQK